MAATNPLRREVLGLYRRFLRLGSRWEARDPVETATERNYIKCETQRLFRANKTDKTEVEVREHIREAEARMTMAEHYRNPYPRPVNLPPKSYAVRDGKKAGKAIKKRTEMSRPIYNKSMDDKVVT